MKQRPSVIMPGSVLRDIKKEPLSIVIPVYQGLRNIPIELKNQTTPEGFVFAGLVNCFQRAGFVAEGLLGNIIWGFRECGHPEKKVAQGLTKLRNLGYLYYTSAQRSDVISETNFDPNKPIWIRYSTKMLDIFYRPEAPNAQGIILPSV